MFFVILRNSVPFNQNNNEHRLKLYENLNQIDSILEFNGNSFSMAMQVIRLHVPLPFSNGCHGFSMKYARCHSLLFLDIPIIVRLIPFFSCSFSILFQTLLSGVPKVGFLALHFHVFLVFFLPISYRHFCGYFETTKRD